ncbi:piwi-like protein Ago3 [Spodoptera litura]|uniref:Piwi-like protein Ago3 n=1 Tax=Spodoptera litura TaxID=69820 RepID=A0A9J7E1K2_SPOLT|nr:piwi-like protein Ago3 [Spodoptera litura]XP_022822731.1 piwi-like protein Ago3 [Spodoptera litura]
MSDQMRGRGRGLALLQALKKSQATSPSDDAPTSTPGPSTAQSVVGESASSLAPTALSSTSMSTGTSIGGRGKIAAMLLAKANAKPGGPQFVPASDISPSLAKGVGRGLKLLQSLQAAKAASAASVAGPSGDSSRPQVSQITEQMSKTSITKPPDSNTRSKKVFREVKETPPVVKKGVTGMPVDVTANYIYLQFEENSVYEYEVRFDPEQDFMNLRYKLLGEHHRYFPNKTFDGTTLYVPHKLPEEALNLISTNPYDSSKVRITIIFRRTRRLSEMIHIYNVIFRNIMNDLQLVRIGREHFNDRAGIPIPQHRLEIWPGYVTAVCEYEGGLMLTLDSTHKVIRTQTVLSYIKETVQSEGSGWKKAMAERLVGCSVMTTYNKKMYRVDSIDDEKTPRSTFEKLENGVPVKISYVDYYKKQYGIEIKDWDQPLLISRDSKLLPGTEGKTDFMISLIPELCQLTGLTDDQRSNFKLMKDVACHTKITPNQRHAAFKKYIETVMKNENAKRRLSGWGLSIAPETINITARTLQPETLFFGNNVRVPGRPNAEWNGEVTKNHVMQAVDIYKWALLYTDRDKRVVADFVDTLKRSCRPMGINVSDPEMFRLPNDRTDAYVHALKKLIVPDLQIVVIICPSARDDRYGVIKKICCADNPVPSQVINARTLMNPNKIRSITQKILLQMNCKLGGTLWNINIPFKSAMVIGIDSYHDVSRKKQSVCAFVASYNQSMTHWYSKVVFQGRGQEIADHLRDCFVQAIRVYLSVNGNLPDRIIIYRDGVGDGELKVIKDFEIPQMQISLSSFEGRTVPAITYLVVQKRINTRIFLKTPGGLENPNPGTIVDHDITRRDWYDFLIVSQKVNQGTVTPTHYVVVHDDSDMTPDQCQRLTYKLCHLYYNWPGTVRVPAPCQYAHKLASLVGSSIHQEPAETLANKLYFL